MLTDYAREHGFVNTRCYVDDGYTGADFNRPALQEMLDDVENGKINVILTKDMSRLYSR